MIKLDTTTEEDIIEYLTKMNQHFIPNLDERVNIKAYSKKIFEHAYRIEYFHENILSGLLAFYINDSCNFSFITTISVSPISQKQGVAQKLLDKLFFLCSTYTSIHQIKLEVSSRNLNAIKFYKKNNFVNIDCKNQIQLMSKSII
ncbi:GNAT family N-acetyltransferase [Brumimicrobium mesophilum]|uniref:GNAT family N-acetyltransferase n=1 Tax=Brumimicrobium mesophilum TaxID=392717 RepID=UPI000D143546|nr:GNAT family N-acetyltransferase [Brumimicrobium mesophilum]